MIKTILHKIISLVVLATLLLPIGIQFAHSFEEHEHIVCNSVDNQHIHEQELDCSFCHVQLNTSSIFEEQNFKLKETTIIDEKPLSSTDNHIQVYLYFNSSRGPPFFIV